MNYYKMIKILLSNSSTFFNNAVSNLNINKNTYIINHNSGSISDPVDKAFCKYKFQPSTLLRKSRLENQNLFSFQPISRFNMEKEIPNIDVKKATTKNTIPPKKLKESCNTSAEISSINVNNLQISLKLLRRIH